MTDRLIKVKVHKRRVGKQCMHCKRPAKVTAVRKFKTETGVWFELNVHYCTECATTLGAIKSEDPETGPHKVPAGRFDDEVGSLRERLEIEALDEDPADWALDASW